MGRLYPTDWAVDRGVKAEGGWGVVCTEQCDFHYSTDVRREIRLWDDADIPYLARMADAVHAHGGLAGIELIHMGYHNWNLISREIPLAPSSRPTYGIQPIQARAIDKKEIASVRRWHRKAALRAKQAGFDLVLVYAAHDQSLPLHFISRRYNRRTDEYGGSMENRVRFLKELIEDTKEAIGDTCAVGVRFGVDELLGPRGITSDGEGREVIEMLAELPDLWDVNCSDWHNDSISSRFSEEGFQEPYIEFVKKVTSKPVVGVGRYTSPDRMSSLIHKGILDIIGAARPSIADPFLPKKIEEGRTEDIRECIGCNVCVGTCNLWTPIRCTQNPTMGESWRRGWHPEKVPAKESDDTIVVVGAGPAGLEAAHILGKRGYEVILAEASTELGGRVIREADMPGLSAWRRVKDYRENQLHSLNSVQILLDNQLTAEDILGSECSLVALATGAEWRRDGLGRSHDAPIEGLSTSAVYTPDDVLGGTKVPGPVIIFDDDPYYMGGSIAETIRGQGEEVTLVTPYAVVSPWTELTLEQSRIQCRLLESGIDIKTSHKLVSVTSDAVTIECSYTGQATCIQCNSIVLVTSMMPRDALYFELTSNQTRLRDAGIKRVTRIGDCYGPGTIAAAVYSGHKYGRELGSISLPDEVPFKRESPALSEDFPPKFQ